MLVLFYLLRFAGENCFYVQCSDFKSRFLGLDIIITTTTRRVASHFFLVSPRDHFVCVVPSFSEMKIIG